MRIDRFGANDTSDEMQRRLYARLRAMTPEQRAAIMLQRIESMRALRRATEHLRKPNGSERI